MPENLSSRVDPAINTDTTQNGNAHTFKSVLNSELLMSPPQAPGEGRHWLFAKLSREIQFFSGNISLSEYPQRKSMNPHCYGPFTKPSEASLTLSLREDYMMYHCPVACPNDLANERRTDIMYPFHKGAFGSQQAVYRVSFPSTTMTVLQTELLQETAGSRETTKLGRTSSGRYITWGPSLAAAQMNLSGSDWHVRT